MVVSRRRNLAHYKKKKEDRIDRLAEFPLGTSVAWIHNSSIVLTVVGHDTELGRIKTSDGRSYVPGELEKHPKQ